MGVKSLVKGVLIEQQNKKYARLLASKSMTYDQWIRAREQEQKQMYGDRLKGDLADAEQEREFLFFLQPGVKLAKDALLKLECYFKEHSKVQICYADEDVLKADGTREYPWFKPEWSPDLFDSYYYFGGLVAVRKSLWKQVKAKKDTEIISNIRKCVELAGGFQKGCSAIGHLKEILSHWENVEQMQKCLQISSYGRQREETKEKYTKEKQTQEKLCYEVWEDRVGSVGEKIRPKVSVIIPSKDHPKILENCLQGIGTASGSVSYEILIVDNGSSEENRKRMEQLIAEYQDKDKKPLCKGIQYLYEPMEFHFSKMCNLGAEHARGELLLFLNDDVELCEQDSLLKMAELASRDYTGAVGMKLYYPESIQIQHAGITNLPMGPVHKLQFLEDNISYYFDSNRGLRNVLGVTAACLMVSKKKFIEAGGFATELRVAFNDVDFCYKLYELGYYNVCRNDCYAYHHESLSRGEDESTEKWKRLQQEKKVLYERHPDLEGVDPYYSEGLGSEGLDTRIRPAYETAGNTKQRSVFSAWKKESASYRQDNCLLVRIENCNEEKIQGYGVVLGDNNACYEYELILKNLETQEIYSVILEGQYRPDLMENMPDQVNVGLCGFWVCINEMQQEYVQSNSKEHAKAGQQNQMKRNVGMTVEQQNQLERNIEMTPGQYQIGMTARNRVTGLKLINFSSRILTIPS